MKIQKLEDLKAWQKARKLANIIFSLLNKIPDKEKYVLKKHLWECARNAPGNIAEAFGRYHFQESMQFYRIARGSLSEIKSDTYLCFDCKYWNKDDFDRVMKQVEKVIQLLNGLIASTKKQKLNY